jgi:aspartate kinase
MERLPGAPGEPQLRLAWVPDTALDGPTGRRQRGRLEFGLGSNCAGQQRAGPGPNLRRTTMALIVHKYGGTSMGSTERIRSVAQRVAKWVRAGHQMVVVPSAMSGETNRLLAWPRNCMPNASTPEALRELDAIAATGEQVSVGLLALALQAQGVPAVSYGGWQVPIQTDSAFTKARISRIDDARVRADLAAGKVVIITGFQGIDPQGNVTTLGRGGSDTGAWRWPRR